ncbi:putative 6-phosphofructo-2-kinase, Fructose-2,6-bisphosphate 2-phosphatase [Helianthus annuus]|nr:putative 6-phosphofructo-2-kinase, Fructose-2,6-bisphosphate 2-phosphatase [Helianthus annuus]
MSWRYTQRSKSLHSKSSDGVKLQEIQISVLQHCKIRDTIMIRCGSEIILGPVSDGYLSYRFKVMPMNESSKKVLQAPTFFMLHIQWHALDEINAGVCDGQGRKINLGFDSLVESHIMMLEPFLTELERQSAPGVVVSYQGFNYLKSKPPTQGSDMHDCATSTQAKVSPTPSSLTSLK